jgi:hypothetical protein
MRALIVATERQIAANRHNARKSSGPRSASGKQRSSKNAFRHGLSKPLSGTEFMQKVEALAVQIAGDRKDQVAIELARSAAKAELELARVRHLKAELIEGIAAFGRLDFPDPVWSSKDGAAGILRQIVGAPDGVKRPKLDMGALPSILAEKPEHTAEAVRRALPELVSLVRYETRAAARRDRAIRALIGGKSLYAT